MLTRSLPAKTALCLLWRIFFSVVFVPLNQIKGFFKCPVSYNFDAAATSSNKERPVHITVITSIVIVICKVVRTLESK